ncbi:60S ribosomal protein L35ae, putative [Plasmodium malariae]|uniref:60S ribosomal protein L35ae, putative n=1 Tax=Plasmodium malariae TaxID=5858 RepID=A0A1A8W1U7_PLAMA|nr:60S ribosomal protein L35ae, putative [Plasmodium malariae]
MDKGKNKKQNAIQKKKKVAKKVVKKAIRKKNTPKKKLQAVRLYEKGVILGYKRSEHAQCFYELKDDKKEKEEEEQKENISKESEISIRNVHTKKDAQFYVGKRIAYVYRTNKHHNGVKIKCIWGKVCRTHGNSGVIRARFKTHIPPKAFGDRVRILMYPSNI